MPLSQRTLTGSIVRAAGERRLLSPVVSSERQRVFLVSLGPRDELPRHTAPGELTLFVVSGAVVVSVAAGQQTLESGGAILVPMGEEHGIENRSQEMATVLGVLQLRGAGESAGRPSDGYPTAGAVIVDALQALPAADANGVIWTLEGSSELNVNVVQLEPDHSIEEHENDAVDVLIVALAGNGELLVDGAAAPLENGVVAHVPRGSLRSVRAGSEPLRYLSLHRRRSGPMIRSRPSRRPTRSEREHGVPGEHGAGVAQATNGERGAPDEHATGAEGVDGEGSRP